MTTHDASIRTQFRTIDGVSVRFAESESRDDHALLLSPWPESLFAFEQMWARLAEHTHLVAVDLPGFGHSDGRPELIAPDSSGAFLARLIDEWGLGAPHVVADSEVGTDRRNRLGTHRTELLIQSLVAILPGALRTATLS